MAVVEFPFLEICNNSLDKHLALNTPEAHCTQKQSQNSTQKTPWCVPTSPTDFIDGGLKAVDILPFHPPVNQPLNHVSLRGNLDSGLEGLTCTRSSSFLSSRRCT
jgi:hypothetical protein